MILNNKNTDEMRVRTRFEIANNILCFKIHEPTGKLATKIPVLINIVDISYGGLGIITKQKLNIGSVLSFNVKYKFELFELSIKIKWSKYIDNLYKSGGGYVNLKYEDLIFIDKIIKNK